VILIVIPVVLIVALIYMCFADTFDWWLFEGRYLMIMSQAEHDAVDMAGRLYTFIAENVVARGETREADLAELRMLIHGIQHAVMAQAAARSSPSRYRLLGGVIRDKES
jgi:hypothetical protein